MLQYTVELVDTDGEMGKNTRYCTFVIVPRVGDVIVLSEEPYVTMLVTDVIHHMKTSVPRKSYITLFAEKQA